MKALILIAHGSRIKNANQEIQDLTEKLKTKLHNRFPIIRSCFLEMSSPKFEIVVTDLVKQEINDIVVLPLFITQGKHVRHDIPDLINEAKKSYPNLKFRLLPYLVKSPYFIDLIENLSIDGD